jgi:hypothetical protein
LDALRQQADALGERLSEERLARAAVRERRRHTAEELERLTGRDRTRSRSRAGWPASGAMNRSRAAAASEAAGVAARDRSRPT